MKIGAIVRADDTGLGYQTYEFARNIGVDKVLIVDIDRINRRYGKITKTDPSRYDGFNSRVVEGFPLTSDFEWLTDDVDLVYTIEIPYGYDLFTIARRKNVRTVLEINYEFLDYFKNPTLAKPDALFSPSVWNRRNLEELAERFKLPVYFLPVPIDLDEIPYQTRNFAKRFVHVKGYETNGDRNGTGVVYDAIKFVESCDTIRITGRVPDRKSLYADADVLILPRRYGGLSLVYQEALAAGIVPIVGSEDPYAESFDPYPFPTLQKYTVGEITTRLRLNTYNYDPKELARIIDSLYGKEITELSLTARKLAKSLSWGTLKPDYLKAFKEICETSS